MSERTTIGGISYESIGSSSSNLLLKSNGTVRVQWGGKLIDLIKNGKIASGESSIKLEVINDISEIKSDGVYVLSQNESLQFIICKDGEQYNVTNTDLYISAKTTQDLTVEQRQQALTNIGMYYNTLEEVQQASIKNGLVYVISDQTLYTVKDGVITEFEAKLKTVTVEKEQQEGEVINSDVKIVLTVSDLEYLVVGQGQILVNYPMRIKDTAGIESTNASTTAGYRLYIDSQGSHLDIDYLNVRKGLPNTEFIETPFEEFYQKLTQGQLQAHKWYLITDYQNPWQLKKASSNTRPILVRALTSSSLYPEGKLYNDQRIIISYDPQYVKDVKVEASGSDISLVKTKGCITKMTDAYNNSANFDFLDYGTEEDPGIVLHTSQEDANLDSSVFPIGSYNNTITINDLKGTVLDENGEFNGNSRICFAFEETVEIKEGETKESGELITMQMHDNVISCNGLILEKSCENFFNNTITNITSDIPIKTNITNSIFGDISGESTAINCSFNNVTFKNIHNCQFGEGLIENLKVNVDISGVVTSQAADSLLYDGSQIKEAYVSNNTLQVIVTKEQTFFKGMIVMHAGNASIPEGWGICDGRIEEYNGEKIQTPNLIGNFIKAVGVDQCGPGGSSEITIGVENLPSHTHTYEILTEDSKKIRIHEGDDIAATAIPQYTIEHTQTEATGSGKAITIDPQHYGLIFIMKL